MNISNTISNTNWKSGLIFALVGLLIGWFIFGGAPSESTEQISGEDHAHEANTEYTCSMHPQIRQDAPGSCPICGMDLIPLENDEKDDGDGDGNYTIKLTNAAMKIAEVSSTEILKKAPFREVYLSGRVMMDERKLNQLSAHFSGRVEELFVTYIGQKVKKGQLLASIYSDELVTAQKELLEASKYKSTNPTFYKAVKDKLKNWMIPSKEIESIEQTGKVKYSFNIYSNMSGVITKKFIQKGGHIMEGMKMFEIVDLSKVWVIFDAYESDLPWIKLKDKIKFTIPSLPNEVFESTVTFIDPILNGKSRVAGVRTELSNSKRLLKPQMLASGKLIAMLNNSKEELLVPKTSILWTGKKAVVYVRTNDHQNMFQYREITLGADAGDYYVVSSGLGEGELVATNGVFKIDAAAQLKGKQSMMNPSGGKVALGGHANMDMGGDSKKKEAPISSNMDKKEGAMNMANMDVDSKFKDQFKAVFKNYLALKDAFVGSNAKDAQRSAEDVLASLEAVNMSLVKGDMHIKWMVFLKAMKAETTKIQKSNDIKVQRASLFPLSEALYGSIKYFMVDGINAYYQFCPMANDSKGANWLSITEDIKNPYFGEDMLTCGETKEKLQ